MSQFKSRSSRAVIACLVLAIGTTLLASCSSPDEAREATKPVTREASVTDIAGAVVKGAFTGYTKLKACLANQKIGEPCLASDASNIRRTLEEVKKLRALIERNQAQMKADFNAILDELRGERKRDIAENLTPMVENTQAAGRAYEALALCAQTTTGKCRPYNGALGPEEDASGAIEKTERYFSLKAKNLPEDLLTTSAWFTGTDRSGFDDGLADAIWRYNKGQQDAQAGVSSTVQGSETVPVVGPELARNQNIDLAYWKDVFSEYAFILVMFVGQSQGEADAESIQNEANENVASMERGSVFGSAEHYSLPEFPGEDRGMILAEGNRAWILSLGSRPNGSTELAPKDVAEMARIVNTYGSVESFKRVPDTMPPERLYRVRAPIEKVDYKRLGYVAGGIDEAIKISILQDTTVHWLDENSQDDCPTKVKPLIEPQPRQKPQYGDELDWSDPKVDPANRIQATWERYVKDQPIAYTWDLPASGEGERFAKLGWGAWIACAGGTFIRPDSRLELREVPAVMGPAN